jgi:hypothetical protein
MPQFDLPSSAEVSLAAYKKQYTEVGVVTGTVACFAA